MLARLFGNVLPIRIVPFSTRPDIPEGQGDSSSLACLTWLAVGEFSHPRGGGGIGGSSGYGGGHRCSSGLKERDVDRVRGLSSERSWVGGERRSGSRGRRKRGSRSRSGSGRGGLSQGKGRSGSWDETWSGSWIRCGGGWNGVKREDVAAAAAGAVAGLSCEGDAKGGGKIGEAVGEDSEDDADCAADSGNNGPVGGR